MVQGREGTFPASKFQLLVYVADGRLDVVADFGQAATFEWRSGADGPKIARALVTGSAHPI
jgi:hypothetical protein